MTPIPRSHDIGKILQLPLCAGSHLYKKEEEERCIHSINVAQNESLSSVLSSQLEPCKFFKADSGALKFQVKSSSGAATLHLFSKCTPHRMLYKIRLGTTTLIQDHTTLLEAAKETPHIVLTQFKEFWITWFGNKIRVGTTDNSSRPFHVLTSGCEVAVVGYVRFNMKSNNLLPFNSVEWKVEDTPFVIRRPLKATSSEGLQWLPFRNELPPNAMIGGLEVTPLYVARAHHNGSLAPGKYRPDTGYAYVAWGQLEHVKEEFEVLCGLDAKWQYTHGNRIPENAVIGGYSEVGGVPLYIGRAYHDGHLLIGKVHSLYRTCYLPYNGHEIEKSMVYEILVSPSIPCRGFQMHNDGFDMSSEGSEEEEGSD